MRAGDYSGVSDVNVKAHVAWRDKKGSLTCYFTFMRLLYNEDK